METYKMATKLLMLEVCILVLSASAFNGNAGNAALIPGTIKIDKETAKEAELAFQDALNEELPGFQDVQLFEARHKRAVVNLNASALPDAGKPGSIVDMPDDTVSEFEKDVTELILGLSKGGSAATPFGKSVQKIKDVIEKDMMVAVNHSHISDQTMLYKLAAAVKQCTTEKNSALRKAQPINKTYYAISDKHKTCRTTEAGLYTDTMNAWKDMKAKKKIMKTTCQQFSDLSKKLGEQNNNKQIVSKGATESVETYVRRITATICGKPGGKGTGGNGKGGFLDLFLNAKIICETNTRKYNAAYKLFVGLDKRWRATQTACNNLQDAMDGAACKYAVAVKDACERYEECYRDKKAIYDSFENETRHDEVDRKAEWRGLSRMLCIILAFTDGQVSNAEIEACRAKNHSTEFLNITYPVIAPIDPCRVPSLYPYTGAYKAREYKPLPALAKGKMDANPCSGLETISTTPAPGSPASCKCERITMNGPFSPGAMVKCTGCTDVRRSSDALSCPVGTKLFSPQGRTDWDTFLKSAGPLRAPNWIVDVTRPQNGCGGCTKYNMNSGVAQQKTWTTKDGSPWWLRSTRYNEPNGDYHANCYLDLWHTPKDADSVTWNDGSCSYHAKSYYCQKVKITLEPKPGSPNGCSCKKVEIARGESYSSPLLIKCTNCLKVYKSNDKNSCPVGTKIFSPASRADWKAFLASAGPLRAPYWIIDITRPQNGCGGCTKNTMTSTTPAQSTWKTADGSPWWLRSSRYNEPNGDYNANCYLDLWHTPVNENSVTWNDWRCKYYSKSYYCQQAKANEPKLTTTAPPWHTADCSTTPATGSPNGCKCTTLTLKGKYSAGCIVKCENCIQTYKSTQKNSCPDGTKLFAPQSRGDWSTFLASNGAPLRAPHWIIDVTRPQNGCGGCTKHAMKSDVPQQSTWRTKDGAPWWLRASRYNEPNGDYKANCYLDLWKTPANAASVTWNDGNCNYHSRSYYCQLRKP